MSEDRHTQKADAVFEGGGVKGIGLVGALQAFEEHGFRWQNLAGTSAGAITAALVAVGYKAMELKEVMNTRVDIRNLMDTSGIGKLPVIGPWLSLIFTQGMYQGEYFLQVMRELIAEKTGKQRFTFADLVMPKEPDDSEEDYERKYKYKLRVIACDISDNTMLVLPQDVARLDRNPDDLEVALAVRMSISFPFFFKPVIVQEAGRRRSKHWTVDGGMLSNFPIWLFDSPPGRPPAWPTIGFLLAEPASGEPHYQRIRGLVSMTRAMVKTMTAAHDRKALEGADKRRIVQIPTGKYNTLDFNLNDSDREWLYSSGYQAAKQFLSTWSFEEYRAQRLQLF